MVLALVALQQGTCAGFFISWLAFVIAALEIEIEGSHGWASSLPTWRRSSWLCGGKRMLTGYHVFLASTLISACLTGVVISGAILQQPYVGVGVLLSLSVFVFAMLIEDSFWFVLNDEFWDALESGQVVNHFQSNEERIWLYVSNGTFACLLWLVGYGAWDAQWQLGATALGFLLASLILSQIFVRSVVKPLYTIWQRQMHNKSTTDCEAVLSASCMLLCVTLLILLLWSVAIGVWQWR